MAWLIENWFWILVFIAFIAMHTFGHGGHGAHGGSRDRQGSKDIDEGAPVRVAGHDSGNHQH
jgi:hypothetical protein